jgi:hypothetical protein
LLPAERATLGWGRRITMQRAGSLIALGSVLLLVATLAQAQTSIDAAYYQGRVEELPKNKPGKLDAGDAEILQFTWEKGNWKVLYSEVKTTYVALSRRSVMVEVFGVPGGKRKLFLSLVVADRPGATRNCVFYLPRGATRDFMRALETKTGRRVVYESEEARKAAEGQ